MARTGRVLCSECLLPHVPIFSAMSMMPCTRRASVTAAVMPFLRRGKNGAVEKYLNPPLGRLARQPGSRHHLPRQDSAFNKKSEISIPTSNIRICQKPGTCRCRAIARAETDRKVVRVDEAWQTGTERAAIETIPSFARQRSTSSNSSASLAPPDDPARFNPPPPPPDPPTPDTFFSPLRNRQHDGH